MSSLEPDPAPNWQTTDVIQYLMNESDCTTNLPDNSLDNTDIDCNVFLPISLCFPLPDSNAIPTPSFFAV